ncbi:methyl-CpG-binding domain-containing protein [Salix suchowensis]|nr:methyl-CpG-binding domain-containing protein [Salix suchowensis]
MALKEHSPVTPKTSRKNPRVAARSIDTYTVQCDKCSKWRVISTEEEYEEIRSKLKESPYVCDRKLGISCDDPTPQGFKRSLVLRRDFSTMDAYYFTPTGKKLRTHNKIAAFIEANPKYQDVKLSAFNFTPPKVMEDTIPEDVVRKIPSIGIAIKRRH